MDENQEGSIDVKARESIAKKRKLCENNHINDNVRTNSKICDREFCKAKLKMNRNGDIVTNVEKTVTKETMDKESMKVNISQH